MVLLLLMSLLLLVLELVVFLMVSLHGLSDRDVAYVAVAVALAVGAAFLLTPVLQLLLVVARPV